MRFKKQSPRKLKKRTIKRKKKLSTFKKQYGGKNITFKIFYVKSGVMKNFIVDHLKIVLSESLQETVFTKNLYKYIADNLGLHGLPFNIKINDMVLRNDIIINIRDLYDQKILVMIDG